MKPSHRGRIRAVLAAGGVAFFLAAPAAAQGFGETLSNLFKFGGTTVPSAAPTPADDVFCPWVGVIEGGAAVQAFTGGKVGDPSSLRHQISIGQLARECVQRPDGSISIKVGVEARALLGPAGSSGRYDVPVTVMVKRGERILSSRTQRLSLSVPPGDTRGSAVVVQDGLVVPPKSGEYEIYVGLVAGPGAAPRRAKRG